MPIQVGERAVALEVALRHGAAAIAALGLEADLVPVFDAEPGAWCCTLRRAGADTPTALGLGQGRSLEAQVGAVFEALERHLRDDRTGGWAAGVTRADATVHALTELIERDAFTALLFEQFRRPTPPPLPVIDRDTLPADTVELVLFAEAVTGKDVHLIDMTADTAVPAVMAYQSARTCGWGASLSRRQAATHAVNELVQTYCTSALRAQYPYLSAHRRANLSAALSRAVPVGFVDTDAPDTPDGHLAAILEILRSKGFFAYPRVRYVSEHLAVVNVLSWPGGWA